MPPETPRRPKKILENIFWVFMFLTQNYKSNLTGLLTSGADLGGGVPDF